jgi:hypothetical protein
MVTSRIKEGLLARSRGRRFDIAASLMPAGHCAALASSAIPGKDFPVETARRGGLPPHPRCQGGNELIKNDDLTLISGIAGKFRAVQNQKNIKVPPHSGKIFPCATFIYDVRSIAYEKTNYHPCYRRFRVPFFAM